MNPEKEPVKDTPERMLLWKIYQLQFNSNDGAYSKIEGEMMPHILAYKESAQTAELAEAASRIAGLEESLANVAGYLASVRTDRRVERDGDVFVLQTLEWAEVAAQFAEDVNRKPEEQEVRSATSQEASK